MFDGVNQTLAVVLVIALLQGAPSLHRLQLDPHLLDVRTKVLLKGQAKLYHKLATVNLFLNLKHDHPLVQLLAARVGLRLARQLNQFFYKIVALSLHPKVKQLNQLIITDLRLILPLIFDLGQLLQPSGNRDEVLQIGVAHLHLNQIVLQSLLDQLETADVVVVALCGADALHRCLNLLVESLFWPCVYKS